MGMVLEMAWLSGNILDHVLQVANVDRRSRAPAMSPTMSRSLASEL